MKYHFFAGLASVFIVGLGQALKGDGRKAIIYLLIFYFCLPALVYTSLAISGQLFIIIFTMAIILGLLLWLYNIFDALFKP